MNKNERTSGMEYSNIVEEVDTWDSFDFVKFGIFLGEPQTRILCSQKLILTVADVRRFFV